MTTDPTGHATPADCAQCGSNHEQRIAALCETVVRLRLELGDMELGREVLRARVRDAERAAAATEARQQLVGEVERLAAELESVPAVVAGNGVAEPTVSSLRVAARLRALAATAPPAAPSGPQSQDPDQDIPQWERDFLARQEAAERGWKLPVRDLGEGRFSINVRWDGEKYVDVHDEPTAPDQGMVREAAGGEAQEGAEGPLTAVVSVRLDATELAALDAFARRHSETRSGALRLIIRRFVDTAASAKVQDRIDETTARTAAQRSWYASADPRLSAAIERLLPPFRAMVDEHLADPSPAPEPDGAGFYRAGAERLLEELRTTAAKLEQAERELARWVSIAEALSFQSGESITAEDLAEAVTSLHDQLRSARAAGDEHLQALRAEVQAEREGWANTRKLLHDAITERDKAREALKFWRDAVVDMAQALGVPNHADVEVEEMVQAITQHRADSRDLAEARQEAERLRGEVDAVRHSRAEQLDWLRTRNAELSQAEAGLKWRDEQIATLRAQVAKIADWCEDMAENAANPHAAIGDAALRLRALASTGGSDTTGADNA